MSTRQTTGWHAYRPRAGAELPTWPVEVALAIEYPAEPTSDAAAGGRAQALLLLRSPSRVPSPLRALAAAAREVEAAAGVQVPVELPLAVGPALPGLVPIAPTAMLAHLAAASARGLAPPARRRQPAAGEAGTWRSSAGSVLTCDGPGGRSAQAVITLRGVGDGHAIAPPSGGALVLRAWRARRGWGLACGLVLGSAEAMGLGREAGRRAADARAAGWLAAVATGQAALALARAGDPRQPGRRWPPAGSHPVKRSPPWSPSCCRPRSSTPGLAARHAPGPPLPDFGCPQPGPCRAQGEVDFLKQRQMAGCWSIVRVRSQVMSSSAPHWPDDGTERPGERPALRVVPPLAPHRPQPGGRPAAGDPAGEWSRLAGLREPSERDLAAARRRARPQLPSPVAVTRDVAMALLEVEAGCRSAAQIERICSPELWVRLEHRIGRRGGPLPSGRSAISVRCQENRPGVADTVVVVRRGERMLPVAMRLDAAAGRWTVTELRWWCTEHDPEAPACRGDRGEW